MQFKRLRLSGFKSFVDPTELWIEPGLTGVVGPNGCGKSNLLEALRWVMGESRPKSLRGGGMEDVIFAGTVHRPSRNLADVNLLLDNSERTAPAQFNDDTELEVSRRIERDLGSVYKINGRDVRQKDIQLLFADAATGAHSPALVSQGRVGALINAKPQDRRQLLEEAAGISGLHSRRKEAEQKLKAASTNLERLEDVLSRMEGQAASLRRQAKQATRYRELSEKLRHLEAQLLYARWRVESAKLEESKAQLDAAEAAVAEATSKSAQLAKVQAEAAANLPDLRQAEAEAAAALSRLEMQMQKLEDEQNRLEALKADLARRLSETESDSMREADYRKDADEALASLAGDIKGLQATISQDAGKADAAKADLAEAQHAASEVEAKFDETTNALANARAREETAHGAVRAAQARLSRASGEIERLEATRESLKAQMDQDEALSTARTELAQTETALGKASSTREETEAALETARAAADAAKANAQSSSAALKELQSEIQGLSAALAAGDQSGGAEPIGDMLNIAAGLELALGAALGDGLETPIESGVRHWRLAQAKADDPALPEGAEALSKYVSGADHLGRRLTQTGLVPDEGIGDALYDALKPGQQLVSREGSLWRWDGYRALADAPSRASLRLKQRNHLKALERQVGNAETSHQAAIETAETADEKVIACRAELDETRRNIGTLRSQADQLRRTVATREKQASALTAKVTANDALHEAAVETLAQAKQDLAEAEEGVRTLPDLSLQTTGLERLRETVTTARETLADARSSYDRIIASAQSRKRALERAKQDQAAWQARIDKAASQHDTLVQRQHEIRQALADLESRPDEITGQRAQLLESIEAKAAARSRAADRVAEVESGVAALDGKVRAIQEVLASAREQRGRIEAEREAIETRKEELALTSAETFHCPPALLVEHCGVESEADIGFPADLSQEMERRKLERERLGAVNLRADIELEEIESEAATLRTEKEELETAIARLRGAIGSLNREGRTRLMQAFEEVNTHFGQLFTTLFGGGEAHIELIESDDPLEAGLEIMAMPPGKKLQSLSLLSGGEQALTALSLIFAVFMTNPAPICVLDEVDAPLDDANVERFCNLLDEMVSLTNTRFLIVTHNAISMSRMHRLFGVTMAEKGVSQLVSVDLGQAETLIAAE